jgi:LAS superfamily LD-carboxypeptidase LdcB
MYNKMIAKAKQEGVRWRVSSTYRDLAGQEACFAKYGSGSAAKPGYSPHGWGLALDFGEICGMQQDRAKTLGVNRASASAARYTRENSKIYQWLAKNGPNYGWYNPYRLADGTGMDEAWHWEYWGFYTLTKQQRES